MAWFLNAGLGWAGPGGICEEYVRTRQSRGDIAAYHHRNTCECHSWSLGKAGPPPPNRGLCITFLAVPEPSEQSWTWPQVELRMRHLEQHVLKGQEPGAVRAPRGSPGPLPAVTGPGSSFFLFGPTPSL